MLSQRWMKTLLGFEKTMMTNEKKRLEYAKQRVKLLKQERDHSFRRYFKGRTRK